MHVIIVFRGPATITNSMSGRKSGQPPLRQPASVNSDSFAPCTSFVSNLAENGCDLSYASTLARHASIQTTQKYYVELKSMKDKRKGLAFLTPPKPEPETQPPNVLQLQVS